VSAPDPRTVLIRWSELYPDAASIRDADLEPLPRHLLAAELEGSSPDVFVNLPYWGREFVGHGPYKLAGWEPGSSIEGVAFDGHALGRAKIDRVIVRFISDENTMMTALLAGGVDIAMDNALRFEQAIVLRRDWEREGKGTVLLDPSQPRLTNIQFRPDLVNPRALLELPVRRAVAHSVDKNAINEGLFDGQVPLADQFLSRTTPYFAELDRSIVKYPYDLRQTEQLMAEAGYRKAGDGAYVGAAGDRFAFEHWVIAGSQNEKQSAIMADGWRRAGFEVKEYAIPAAQSTDGQVRATFPSLSSVATGGGERNLNFLASVQIPTPANRWRGNNRGAWSSPRYDELWQAFNTTLDRSARTQQAIQMMRIATEDVAMFFLFHSPNVTAFVTGLRGPEIGTPDTLSNWNIHEWDFAQRGAGR
jgi:peptide/nickel transport system substrate-binding protein